MRRGAVLLKPQIAGGFVTPTLAWYDPSNAGSITSSLGVVSAVNDLSGNGHTLSVVGATGAVITGTDTINSLNVLKFPATNTSATGGWAHLESGNITQAQPITALIICRLYVAASLTVAAGEALGEPLLLGTWPTTAWALYSGSLLTAGTPDTTAHILSGIFNGGSSALYLDAASIASGSGGTTGYSAAPISLGAKGGTGAGPITGDLGETLLYASALSPTVLAAQQAYLKAKWATP